MNLINYIINEPENWSFIGVIVFVLIRWYIQYEKKEQNRTKKKWEVWIKYEINDWVICLSGAVITYYLLTKAIGGLCYIVPYIEYETCVDASTYLDEFLHLISGTSLGHGLVWLYKFNEKRKHEKLKD